MCSVFFLTNKIDGGDIIAQKNSVENDDSFISLGWKGMKIQADIQAKVVKDFLNGIPIPRKSIEIIPENSYYDLPTIIDYYKYRKISQKFVNKMDSSFTSLLYHSVGDYKENEYDIEFEVFKNQINWLKREGYVVESIEMFNQRKNKIPEKYVILTFDDGYKSFLNAAKFLTKIGFSGTFFLTKNWCEKKSNFLDKNQIKELSKIQDVGSHSVSHPYLTKIKKPNRFRTKKF